MKKIYQITYLVLLGSTLTSSSQHEPCSIRSNMGYCKGASGKFLSYSHADDILKLFIDDSDMRYLYDSDISQFRNLTILTIDNSTFPEMKEYTFLRQLKQLEYLSITNSNITGKLIFSSENKLRDLSLRSNKLTRLSNDFFSHLKEVEFIDISNNYITNIDTGTFNNLRALKRVNLTNNNFGKGFDPLFLSLFPSVCWSLLPCAGSWKERCSEWCRGNVEVDALWSSLRGLKVEVHMDGNPICKKTKEPDPLVPIVLEAEAVLKESGQLMIQGRYPLHPNRNVFLWQSCVPEAKQTQTLPLMGTDAAVLFTMTTGPPHPTTPQQEGLGKKVVEAGGVQQEGAMWFVGIGAFLAGVMSLFLLQMFSGFLRQVFRANKSEEARAGENHRMISPTCRETERNLISIV